LTFVFKPVEEAASGCLVAVLKPEMVTEVTRELFMAYANGLQYLSATSLFGGVQLVLPRKFGHEK